MREIMLGTVFFILAVFQPAFLQLPFGPSAQSAITASEKGRQATRAVVMVAAKHHESHAKRTYHPMHAGHANPGDAAYRR
jgi:hypothetical protein